MKLSGIFDTREVFLDGKKLSPGPSQKLRHHSPDGFNWGYGGSGPAQLALAVLLETRGKDYALENYQAFKWNVISRLPQTDFSVELVFFADQLVLDVREQGKH